MPSSWDKPPEFTADGAPPPVVTTPLVVDTTFEMRTSDATAAGDPLAARALTDLSYGGIGDFQEAHHWLVARLAAHPRHRIVRRDLYRLNRAQRQIDRFPLLPAPLQLLSSNLAAKRVLAAFGIVSYSGLLRLRRLTFWERADPITQVAPGNKTTVVLKTTLGLSVTDTHELSQSLGIEAGLSAGAKLTAQVAEKFGISVTQTTQREETTQVDLSGPTTADRYRYYALWRRGQALEIDLLTMQGGHLAWQNEYTKEYLADSSVVQTYYEGNIER